MNHARVGAVCLLAGAVLLADGACTVPNEPGCSGDCPLFPSTLWMSCAPNDLSSVQVTGPCVGNVAPTEPDASRDYDESPGGEYVGISSSAGGTCHVVLTFATGFVFATDVQFDVQGESCGCVFVMPATAKVAVDNPSSTCTGDAGVDSSG